MKRIVFICLLMCVIGCNGNNSYTLYKVISGNQIQLTNGVIVELKNVLNNNQNIPVIQHYLSGSVILINEQNEEVSEFASDHITATAFNSDGDEINKLLISLSKISNSVTRLPNSHFTIDKTIIKLTMQNGVMNIPVIINEEKLYLIFDTGASMISISLSTAEKMLCEGKLKKTDFIGKGNFTDATGRISEGLIVNLREVEIGNKILYDVNACVSESQDAPLLFGQSAMQKFGKLSIDYLNNEITLE